LNRRCPGRFGEVVIPFPLPGSEPRFLGRPAPGLVTIPTKLSRLTLGLAWWVRVCTNEQFQYSAILNSACRMYFRLQYKLQLLLDVRGSVHHSTSHKKKSNKMQQCIKSLLFHIYMKLNMFRATQRPSSGALNCTGSLWFFIRGRLLANNRPRMKKQRLPVQF